MGRHARVGRDEVLRAAREAFGERGYDGTTLAVIAGRLGLSPAALLRHAPSKEALFAAAVASEDEPFPLAFLAQVDASREDPRQVLRRFAHALAPYLESRIGPSIALWMRQRALATMARTFHLPWDPLSKQSPPMRLVLLLEDYFRRAAKARRLRVRDPRAAAIAFVGALLPYVALYRLLKVLQPPMPLDQYLDVLLEIWTHGAIPVRRKPPRSRIKR